MKGIVWLVLLALTTGPVLGQTVIVKCKDRKGVVIFQTPPCDPGQSAVDVKQYAPVYDNPYLAEQTRTAQREVDARRATYGNRSQAAYIPNDGRGPACAAAKADREAVLKGVGLNRNFNLLRSLDERVQRACR